MLLGVPYVRLCLVVSVSIGPIAVLKHVDGSFV